MLLKKYLENLLGFNLATFQFEKSNIQKTWSGEQNLTKVGKCAFSLRKFDKNYEILWQKSPALGIPIINQSWTNSISLEWFAK